MDFLKKMMGMGTSASADKKEEIKGIFESNVERGADYTVLAAMHMVTTKNLLKEVRTYYNYILGYKGGDDPEIVVISTDSELSGFEDPVVCKKSECTKAEYLTETGSFCITHPSFDEPLPFAVIASTAWGGYVISVSYVDEFTPFMEFFTTQFAK